MKMLSFLKVESSQTEERLIELSNKYIESMNGTLPFPCNHFNPVFLQWQKLAIQTRQIGYLNENRFAAFKKDYDLYAFKKKINCLTW